MMPGLRTSGEGVMVTLSTVSEMGPYLFRPMRRSSVLSALSLRRLKVSHDLTGSGFGAEEDPSVICVTVKVQVEVPNDNKASVCPCINNMILNMDFWSLYKDFRRQAENVNKVILMETNKHPLSHNPVASHLNVHVFGSLGAATDAGTVRNQTCDFLSAAACMLRPN